MTTTAAGHGQYAARGIDADKAAALADRAMPGLLAPSLRSDPTGGADD